ncbi:hypothetical protein CYMTET_13707 [Cymbomonas tetramitiformis]|uniref:Cyclic nucleotide-binding domain-containing protein n=1 Tax=Cymbomonas tetramitiformis TaxID=36881 RepID=A0AAE0GHU3_9CHLO|nr:hypothetical protein CYMTET_13707 [Cymbomonas tetramitiformis]
MPGPKSASDPSTEAPGTLSASDALHALNTFQASSKFFRGFDAVDIDWLAENICTHTCVSDEVLVARGDRPTFFSLVISGHIFVRNAKHESKEKLEQGDIFGEIEFFTEEPRPYDLVAGPQGCVIAIIKFAELDMFHVNFPDLGLKILQVLAHAAVGHLLASDFRLKFVRALFLPVRGSPPQTRSGALCIGLCVPPGAAEARLNLVLCHLARPRLAFILLSATMQHHFFKSQGSQENLLPMVQEAYEIHHCFGHQISDSHLKLLTDCMHVVELDEGELLLHEGDVAVRMFLVLKGTIVEEVNNEGDGRDDFLRSTEKMGQRMPVNGGTDIAHIRKPGEIYGEQSLLLSTMDHPYIWDHDVRATEKTVVAVMRHDLLYTLNYCNPDLGIRLMVQFGALVMKRWMHSSMIADGDESSQVDFYSAQEMQDSLQPAIMKAPTSMVQLRHGYSTQDVVHMLEYSRSCNENLAELTLEDLYCVAEMFQLRLVNEGAMICNSGDASDFLGVMTSGTANCFVGKKLVMSIEAGHIFGEMSLFCGGVRQASIVSTNQGTVVACLPFDNISVINGKFPDLGLKLVKIFGKSSVQKLMKSLPSTPCTINNFVKDKAACPDYEGMLKAALSVNGRCRSLTPEQHGAIMSSASYVEIPSNQLVARSGEQIGNQVFMVLSGQAVIKKRGIIIDVMNKGNLLRNLGREPILISGSKNKHLLPLSKRFVPPVFHGTIYSKGVLRLAVISFANLLWLNDNYAIALSRLLSGSVVMYAAYLRNDFKEQAALRQSLAQPGPERIGALWNTVRKTFMTHTWSDIRSVQSFERVVPDPGHIVEEEEEQLLKRRTVTSKMVQQWGKNLSIDGRIKKDAGYEYQMKMQTDHLRRRDRTLPGEESTGVFNTVKREMGIKADEVHLELQKFMRCSRLVRWLSEEELVQLADRMFLLHCEPMEWLFRSRQPTSFVLFIIAGSAVIITKEDDGASISHQIGPGSILGEMGWFLGGGRSADVAASMDGGCTVAVLLYEQLDLLFKLNGRLGLKLARILASSATTGLRGTHRLLQFTELDEQQLCMFSDLTYHAKADAIIKANRKAHDQFRKGIGDNWEHADVCRLLEFMPIVTFPANVTVLEAGAIGSYCLFIISGILELSEENGTVAGIVHTGDFCGLEVMFTDKTIGTYQYRAASTYGTEVVCAQLNQKSLARLTNLRPDLGAQLLASMTGIHMGGAGTEDQEEEEKLPESFDHHKDYSKLERVNSVFSLLRARNHENREAFQIKQKSEFIAETQAARPELARKVVENPDVHKILMLYDCQTSSRFWHEFTADELAELVPFCCFYKFKKGDLIWAGPAAKRPGVASPFSSSATLIGLLAQGTVVFTETGTVLTTMSTGTILGAMFQTPIFPTGPMHSAVRILGASSDVVIVTMPFIDDPKIWNTMPQGLPYKVLMTLGRAARIMAYETSITDPVPENFSSIPLHKDEQFRAVMRAHREGNGALGKDLKPYEILELSQLMYIVDVPVHKRIVSFGRVATCMMLVTQGELEVQTPSGLKPGAAPTVLATVGRGTVLGENFLFEGLESPYHRMANVQAKTRSTVCVLTYRALLKFAEVDFEAAEKVIKSLFDKYLRNVLKSTMDGLKSSAKRMLKAISQLPNNAKHTA